jgi:hypothetical protein
MMRMQLHWWRLVRVTFERTSMTSLRLLDIPDDSGGSSLAAINLWGGDPYGRHT